MSASRRFFFFMCGVLLVSIFALLMGCTPKNVKPAVETVTKIVKVPLPLPGWVTIELPLPPEARTVAEHLARERELASTVKLANCHRKLADKLSHGQYADPAICGADVAP